eukprot:CAMPEP_0194409412 /NCGR_PEP_ID=MMETSP0176-20130528/7295_1 /TAXON_ID=216777 /ORGANISM="Proboscia alata, Strain PI-D3" /LENGTH=35 /DNA_ID= /DNA_START= /DNA_END= /DNA_ORIENTATION=
MPTSFTLLDTTKSVGSLLHPQKQEGPSDVTAGVRT